MSGAVAASMPTETQYIRLSIDYSGLKGALEEALSIGSSFRNLSASLAVVVTALPRDPSLYSRITSAPPESVLDTISAVPGQLVQLVVDDSKDNDFWPSRLPLSYITGVTPNFWTRMPKELVKALFQQRIDVTTVYNPARFIQRLRTFGFRVEFVPGEDRLSVVRTIRGAEIKIEKVRHFIDLIQCYLVDEIAVANYINDLVQNSSQSAQGAVIHCLPMQKHPGIEDLDQ
jgi:hypothetical protein